MLIFSYNCAHLNETQERISIHKVLLCGVFTIERERGREREREREREVTSLDTTQIPRMDCPPAPDN